jgi:dTDP-4-dehydrorhamnose reductase
MPGTLDPLLPLEMWGGLECTLNRVGDRFLDQLELNGHAHRLDDLDRFAELGITAIRYPVLWERTAPSGLASADWSWPDSRLARLRELHVRPIVGLVHHGSGPKGTNLLDPAFPSMLAQYAGAVAERYPWVANYTPVNEPLTTARFSALYGYWYPHRRDEGAFFRAVLTQCQGVVAAMQEIRKVNPTARLIQTEDLGEVFARPQLAAQAVYENERRWLSLDFLTGRVVPGHHLWARLQATGITEAELRQLSEEPCPPDVIGINHYLTSERLLDERIERYPSWIQGGNGRETYADVDAVRVCADGPGGWRRLLSAAWERYGLPVAATEVHLGCSREEQLRWLAEVWSTALELRAEGVDIPAVTAWSLLGAFGWNRLVIEEGGDYESGVFDLRAPTPRPTALARLVSDLAAGKEPSHPVLAVPGWWRRPSRFHYPPVDRWGTDVAPPEDPELPDGAQAILIVGPAAPLTDIFVARAVVRAVSCSRLDVSVSSDWMATISEAIASVRPWAVILTTIPTGIQLEDVESVARTCANSGIELLYCSFDRIHPVTEKRAVPYSEHDSTRLVDDRGQTVRIVEQAILKAHPGAMIVQARILSDLETDKAPQPRQDTRERRALPASCLPDLTEAIIDLLIDRERGIWHLADRGTTTWDCAVSLDLAAIDRGEGHLILERQTRTAIPA